MALIGRDCLVGRHFIFCVLVCALCFSPWEAYAAEQSGHFDRIESVVTGLESACALDRDGVQCWGSNEYGLRDIPDLSGPQAISLSGVHACALDVENGASRVRCWGSTSPFGFDAVTAPELVNPTAVSAGFSVSCALHETGVECWGDNRFGQLDVPELVSPVAVSAGIFHTCAIDAAGVACWGQADSGRTLVPALSNPVQVSAGFEHSCAIDDSGVVCWGNNDKGQLNVPPLDNPVIVSAGRDHSCAMDDNGVVCWGDNESGESTVPELSDAVTVSAGIDFSGAASKRELSCWGMDNEAQATGAMALRDPFALDVGGYQSCTLDAEGARCWGVNQADRAKALSGLTVVRAISSGGGDGSGNACAIGTGADGTSALSCWGRDRFDLTKPPLVTNPVAVAVGVDHRCVIADDGVSCWGRSVAPDDITSHQIDPPPLSNPRSVDAGFLHSCALDDSGAVCWGSNYRWYWGKLYGVGGWFDYVSRPV